MKKTAYLNHPKLRLKIPVYVIEERELFGRHEYKCVPLHGTDEQWFSKDKFEFVEDFKAA